MKNYRHCFELRDTKRLKIVIERLKNNEPTSFLYIGGSITSGFHIVDEEYTFSRQLEHILMTRYNTQNLATHNLALPGVPSIFGLYQALQYAAYYKPDVVFIEFAINDMKNPEHQSAFEGMIDYCLRLPTQPAIILLLAKSQVGYTCQNYMDMVAEHYHQSSIFISKAIEKRLEQEPDYEWSNYSNDYGHPNQAGHAFIASLIADFFALTEEASLQEESYPDKPFYNNDLSELSFINQAWLYNGTNDVETSIHYSFSCRHLYILYMVSPDDHYGDAELWVDGEKLEVLSAYRINSWDHVYGHIITLSDEKKKHLLEFKIQKGEENRIFSLLNIGYC